MLPGEVTRLSTHPAAYPARSRRLDSYLRSFSAWLLWVVGEVLESTVLMPALQQTVRAAPNQRQLMGIQPTLSLGGHPASPLKATEYGLGCRVVRDCHLAVTPVEGLRNRVEEISRFAATPTQSL
jgi:hypothetical protein